MTTMVIFSGSGVAYSWLKSYSIEILILKYEIIKNKLEKAAPFGDVFLWRITMPIKNTKSLLNDTGQKPLTANRDGTWYYNTGFLTLR